MEEAWRDIRGFEGIYQISNLGRVKRVAKKIFNNGLLGEKEYFNSKERILKPSIISKGYIGITLTKGKKRYPKKVHRLVAQAFIPNPNNKPQINHIDCDKSNNRVDNLEWCTNSENQKHAFIHGLNNSKKANEVRWRERNGN